MVVAKFQSTAIALYRRLLDELAIEAFNCFDIESVDLMLILHLLLQIELGFIVAEPTNKELLALFTL